MSDLSREEMGAKIQNAFHSIGTEAATAWRPEYEHMVRAFRFNEKALIGSIERDIEDILNDQWSYHAQFSCGEVVIITFRRMKQTKESNNV